MNNIRIASLLHFILIACGLLISSQIESSWFSTRRSRRSERLKKEEQVAKKTSPKKKRNAADLKTLIETSDAQIQNSKSSAELTKVEQKNTPSEQDSQNPPLLDEDKYVLPLELQPSAKPVKEKEVQEELTIEFQFEDADLENLIAQIESIFEVTFITDDMITPMNKQAKALKGNKISFRTNKPLSKQQAWDLFLTFLEIAGFSVVKQPQPNIYRIEQLAAARKAPIPAYIGTKLEDIPSNDQIIRYVYFIENSSLNALRPIVESLKSKDAPLVVLQENRAFILTDKAYNIKTLMSIVKELDKTTMPQAMSVLKLQQANAQDVKSLYDGVIQPSQTPRPLAPRKEPTALYFPENTRIIAEPRTNSLILLGQKDAIEKIEEFIKKNIDVELEQPYSPLRPYQLKYADAETVANIMTKVTEFGKETPAGKVGGVRGGDKYLQPMAFIPEKSTNRVIIKGDYEDYLAAREIIEKLDEAQPQVAIEVLILDVNLMDNKSLGAQIRSKVPGINGLVGDNVKFQTSGLFGQGIVENLNGPGVERLLGNLVELVSSAAVGNTVLTLGQDVFGVWGVLSMLKTISNVQIVSNPFLVATNKTAASVSLGETRRVVTGEVTSGTGFQSRGDSSANLEVKITPQINSDGMIILELEINIDQFSNADPNSGNKSTKQIKTHTIVADKEVLALGGLIKNNVNDSVSKVPVLGNIPILGWLFKNKSKTQNKTNLLVLISSQIIKPHEETVVKQFTDERIAEYQKDREAVMLAPDQRDPITRSFFLKKDPTEESVDDFLFKRRSIDANEQKMSGRNQLANKKRKRSKNALTEASIPKDKHIAQIQDKENIVVHNKSIAPTDTLDTRIKKKERSRASLSELMHAGKKESVA